MFWTPWLSCTAHYNWHILHCCHEGVVGIHHRTTWYQEAEGGEGTPLWYHRNCWNFDFDKLLGHEVYCCELGFLATILDECWQWMAKQRNEQSEKGTQVDATHKEKIHSNLSHNPHLSLPPDSKTKLSATSKKRWVSKQLLAPRAEIARSTSEQAIYFCTESTQNV